MLVRFISCVDCGVMLARQMEAAFLLPDETAAQLVERWFEDSERDSLRHDTADAGGQLAPDSSVATDLRAELSYLGLTADGHALYGRAAHVRRGHAPRRARRRGVVVIEAVAGASRIRTAYLPERMAADEILPGDPPGIWFQTRLGEQPSLIGEKRRLGAAAEEQHAGCEAHCISCGRRQFISSLLG